MLLVISSCFVTKLFNIASTAKTQLNYLMKLNIFSPIYTIHIAY